MLFSIFAFSLPCTAERLHTEQGEFLHEDKVVKKFHKDTQYTHSGEAIYLAAKHKTLKHFKLGKSSINN